MRPNLSATRKGALHAPQSFRHTNNAENMVINRLMTRPRAHAMRPYG
jgi:hypothetical protein